MKKSILILAVAAFAVASLSSCKKCTTCTYGEQSGLPAQEFCGKASQVEAFEQSAKASAAFANTTVVCE